MLTKAITAAAAAAIIFGVASASLAKNGGPPTIDIQKTCRENIAALMSLLGSDILQNMEVCISDEQAARDQLVKEWASYPALAKSSCVHPQEYLPGYIEWQTCLEMTRDVLKMRKEDASRGSGSSAPSASGSNRRPSKRRAGTVTGECPIVKYAEDGSIDYVINCRGLGL